MAKGKIFREYTKDVFGIDCMKVWREKGRLTYDEVFEYLYDNGFQMQNFVLLMSIRDSLPEQIYDEDHRDEYLLYEPYDIHPTIYAMASGYKSRADTIRLMNNEDLADLLLKIQNQDLAEVMKFCENKPECDPNGEIPDENCRQCLLQYLNQEVPDARFL